MLVLAAACLTATPSMAGDDGSDLAQAELARRAAAVGEAQELLRQGDAAYEASRWADAVEAYQGAVELIPAGAPAAAEMRGAAVERYAIASVELAREQRRLGDLVAAGETLDMVLADEVAPGHLGALAMREQLLDPIRTEPASSKEHTADIEEVRLLLYRAESAYNLGKFDQASMICEDVLRVDPTNKAARRLMERTAAAKSDYARAAYDQTRAEMLAQVDEAWQLDVVPEEQLVRSGVDVIGADDSFDYAEKLNSIVIPVVALEDVTIADAVDYIRQQSIEYDTEELDPERKGVNIVVDLGGPDSEVGRTIRNTRFDLNLRNVPLATILEYVCEATRTVSIVQPFAITIRPAGSDSTDLISRTYRVPPDFLTIGSGAGGNDVAANDPFAEQPEGGLLPERLTAEEVLKTRGVGFPDGATAAFNAGNSTLRVRNTQTNHSVIEQIVETLAADEPTAVIVEVRVIKAQQRRLKELGFDWVLGDFSLGGGAFMSGGTPGNGGNLGDIPLPATLNPLGPLTAGNRSGDSAIAGNSIDELILESNQGFARNARRAPGVFVLNGVLNNTQVAMMMRGLDQKTGVDIAVAPSVVTRSGQAASVRVVREFIYPTEYEPPEIPNSVGGGGFIDFGGGDVLQEEVGNVPITPAMPTTFEMQEVGVILDVLPIVDRNKQYVDLTLNPQVIDFDGFVNYGSPIRSGGGPTLAGIGGVAQLFQSDGVEVTSNRILQPVFSKMGTETALTVADGATLVYAGMLQERVQEVEDKTPILGDIPVVGRLFQSKASAPVKTAVVFFVNVRVVDGGGRPFNP